MTKTQPPVSSFNSNLPFSRGWACPPEELAPKPHCAVAITKNLSAAISTLTHKPFYR
jgi:hypothetical protein